MKKQHKYFKNLRHKEKLEGKGDGWRTYWSHKMYLTDEPDPRDIRESTARILRIAEHRNISVEEAVAEHIEWNRRVGTNGSFVYFKKPEVPYTVHKVQTDPKYSRRRKDYKKYSNKRVRQGWKQRNEEYQHGEYKRVFGIAWELD